MPPARQHFGSGQRPVRQPDLRLPCQPEFALCQALPDRRFERQLIGDAAVHFGFIKTDLRVFALGVVHRGIRALGDVLRSRAVVRIERDADGCRCQQFIAIQCNRFVQRSHDFLRNRQRRPVPVAVSQYDGKLVATEPRHGIGFAHRFPDALRDLPQQIIACRMPVSVVDIFETVQVDEQQRETFVFTPRLRDGLLQAILEQTAVGQVGERVVKSHLMQLALHPLVRAQIRKHPDVIGDFALGVAHRVDMQPLGVNVAIFAAVPQLALPDAGLQQVFPHRVIKGPVVIPGMQDVGVRSHRLIERITRRFDKCLIDVNDVRVGIGDHDALGSILERDSGQFAVIEFDLQFFD